MSAQGEAGKIVDVWFDANVIGEPGTHTLGNRKRPDEMTLDIHLANGGHVFAVVQIDRMTLRLPLGKEPNGDGQ